MSDIYHWPQVNGKRGKREPFAGLNYQGRYKPRQADPQEADPPKPRMTQAEGLILCVVLVLSAALVASLASLLWQRWFP